MHAIAQKRGKNLGFVTALLKKGANPNEISDKSSPLHEAVKSGPIELIELLLEHRAETTFEVPAPENPFRKPQLHCDPICHLLMAGHDNVEYVAQVLNTFITRDWSPTKRTVRSLFYNLERRITSGDWSKVVSSVMSMNAEKRDTQNHFIIDPSRPQKNLIIKCLNMMDAANYTGEAMAQLIEVTKIVLANISAEFNKQKVQKYNEGFTKNVMRPILREGIHELFPYVLTHRIKTSISKWGRGRNHTKKKLAVLKVDPEDIPLELLMWYHLSDGGNDRNYAQRFINATKEEGAKRALLRNIVKSLIECGVSLDRMVNFELSLLFPTVWSSVQCKMPFAAVCLLMDDSELMALALPHLSRVY